MKTKDKILKEKIDSLNKRIIDMNTELKKLEETCTHSFVHGYTSGPIVFCEICNKDADELFPKLSYEHIEKLVNNNN